MTLYSVRAVGHKSDPTQLREYRDPHSNGGSDIVSQDIPSDIDNIALSAWADMFETMSAQVVTWIHSILVLTTSKQNEETNTFLIPPKVCSTLIETLGDSVHAHLHLSISGYFTAGYANA